MTVCYLKCNLHLKSIFREAKFCEGRKEMLYLTMHSTHFIYGYMASDIWLRTILIVREETCCRHIGYSFRLAARVLLYAPSHRQDSTYHKLCYTTRGALAGTRNSSMGTPWMINPTTHHTMSVQLLPRSYISLPCSRMEPLQGCEPSFYHPWNQWPSHWATEASFTITLLPLTWHTSASTPSLTRKSIHRICLWDNRSPGPLTSQICKRKEGNVLFNVALNTFYLWLYGVRHTVKDHSDSEKENPLPSHRLLFPISSKGSFISTIPQTG